MGASDEPEIIEKTILPMFKIVIMKHMLSQVLFITVSFSQPVAGPAGEVAAGRQ